MSKRVIAILTSDWHLSHKPPVARSAEPDWYAAMKRPLREISQLQFAYCVPIILVGDIVHHWNEPVELINWILENFPGDVWAVRGQHDMPFHQSKDIHRSAYHTLLQTNRIIELSPSISTSFGTFAAQGFSYGEKVQRFNVKQMDPSIIIPPKIRIAAIHKYLWMQNHSFPGAPKENHVRNLTKILGKNHGYTLVVSGDNHRGFSTNVNGVRVFNCGSLMCRNSDQKNYKPRVGLLYEDGTIKSHFLDTSKDKWLDEDTLKKKVCSEIDLEILIKGFKNLSTKTINFLELLDLKLKDESIDPAVRDVLLNIVDEVK
jgi:predicted phosphodiesterase